MATSFPLISASLRSLAWPPWWTQCRDTRIHKALMAGMSLRREEQLFPAMKMAGLTACQLSERLTGHRTAVNRILANHVQEQWPLLYRIAWELEKDAADVYPLTLHLVSRATRYLARIHANIELPLEECRAYVSYLMEQPATAGLNLDRAALQRAMNASMPPADLDFRRAIENVTQALEPVLQRLPF